MTDTILCAREKTEHPDLAERELHSHDNFEIYSLLSGDADFLVEGSRYPLHAGDLVLMRKGEVHMFRLRSGAAYERMHVNFDLSATLSFLGRQDLLSPFLDRPLGKWNHFPVALFPDRALPHALGALCQAKEEDRLFYLLPLLSGLKEAFETVKSRGSPLKQNPMEPVLAYLNEHLAEEISIGEICARFFISPAHLTRLFRAATGTTVWQYVTIKRLFLAKAFIDAGEKPTTVFSRCGFKDYSTFYRAYKKHFHTAPSAG